jgi:hypothetical protein
MAYNQIKSNHLTHWQQAQAPPHPLPLQVALPPVLLHLRLQVLPQVQQPGRRVLVQPVAMLVSNMVYGATLSSRTQTLISPPGTQRFTSQILQIS